MQQCYYLLAISRRIHIAAIKIKRTAAAYALGYLQDDDIEATGTHLRIMKADPHRKHDDEYIQLEVYL
jgi:hypothetical protein